jgi:hypothetical protein
MTVNIIFHDAEECQACNITCCSIDGSSFYLPSDMRGAQMSPWRAGMSRAGPLVASGFQISASVDS